jgi:RimJ/RimL family protein N-acetyltransferase
MEPRSLGWRTDLIFARFDGSVSARGDHLVVRTPHNPTFWWGNFLLFGHPPRQGDAARWLACFDAEITRREPSSRHLAFGVDADAAFELPRDFAAAGLTLFESTVLTMRPVQLRTPSAPLGPGFEFRCVQLPQEAVAAVDLQVTAEGGVTHAEPDYRLFRERQMQRYGAMQDAGMGHWFGVFARRDDGRAQLVADCGLFRVPGQSLGRFQHVVTHPAWRRRGLCRALIHGVCRHGFETMGLETLVIVADPADVAIGLYESHGFVRGASSWQLERAPVGPA